ncbi:MULTISPECIES: hypothetical protein [Streptomyces]
MPIRAIARHLGTSKNTVKRTRLPTGHQCIPDRSVARRFTGSSRRSENF